MVCELVLIITNIGTAVVLFPALRKYSEAAALDYVAARIVECVFIAVGILSVLTVVTLRQTAGAGSWTSTRPELAFRNPGLRGVEPFAGFGVRRTAFGRRETGCREFSRTHRCLHPNRAATKPHRQL